jgi:hypothetical protein
MAADCPESGEGPTPLERLNFSPTGPSQVEFNQERLAREESTTANQEKSLPSTFNPEALE